MADIIETPSSIRREHIAEMLKAIAAQQSNPTDHDFILDDFNETQLEQVADFLQSFNY